QNSQRAYWAALGISSSGSEARSNHHFAISALESLQNLGNIARIMLAVAIYPNHVLITEFVRQEVAGLDATAKPEMMRKEQYLRACTAGFVRRSIFRTVIDHEHWSSWHRGMYLVNHARDGSLLVQCGNKDQQFVSIAGHSAAT